MKRVFEIDVLVCKECGGKMRVIALLTDPDGTRTVLSHLKLAFLPPETSPARAPPVDPDREPGAAIEHGEHPSEHPLDDWVPDPEPDYDLD